MKLWPYAQSFAGKSDLVETIKANRRKAPPQLETVKRRVETTVR